MNIDHNIVSRAVLTASRPLPSSAIEKVYFGETLSSSEYTVFNKKFQPNTYFDIGKYLDKKLSIINMYKDEFLALGGHDPRMHSCREDSDVFNRMYLDGFKFIYYLLELKDLCDKFVNMVAAVSTLGSIH